ncbi:hypothetical protein QM012_007986 [Aureobasidium pullulans]|uniref:Myb-like domain-containing protein n=1 Tax=Aureobasidium pullulans TaxID=5580 RepID=A0ABR0TLA6_AURPU
MARSKSPVLPISLFDIFLGSGRTIRRPTGPPGVPGKTELVRVRRRVSGQNNGGEELKATSAKGSNKENAQSSSKHSSKKEENKSSSKQDDKKSSSKPSNDKIADAKKAADEPKTKGSKPQAAAQNPSDPVFTPEDDAKILLMKSEGKKMPEIAEAISKTVHQTGQRFGKIKPKDGKQQKGGKNGNENGDKKNDKATDKQVIKTDKEVEEHKSKSNAIDARKQELAQPATILLAGKHDHAHAHRHEVRHDHHVHLHRTHPRRSAHDTHHTRHDSGQSRSRPRKSHHRLAASVAPSSRTAYTIKTMPSLAEDDLFSFGELQALSELIGKDVEGMWHRVSAAFFGMTGRRIAAENIREKFEGLEVE